MNDQIKPSAFFRAFDIAFFVPGTILFVSILAFQISPRVEAHRDRSVKETTISNHETQIAPATRSDLKVSRLDAAVRLFASSTESNWTVAVLQLGAALVAVYALGLICHAIGFLVGKTLCGIWDWFWECAWEKAPQWLKAEPISPEDAIWSSREENYIYYANYFWYLRATSWNTAVAILLSAYVATRPIRDVDTLEDSIEMNIGPELLIASLLLFLIGWRYDKSYEDRKTRCRTLLKFASCDDSSRTTSE